ncbi:hypothetical protein Pmani_039548 [Petrolisthes manimaculis]|uniref:Uncharacterized protein n=1 Tax=Petrolisthes manimaculis TaxID=1843537 RepID=A0AAE1NCA8_9EUCA|nr:hypothetical protein Pmani_039548 [Petrolisthes manimaculis]
MKAEDLLPKVVQEHVKQTGGHFSSAPELHLESILPYAFEVNSNEVFDARVCIYTSSELHIKKVHCRGIGKVKIEKAGQMAKFRAKRLREEQKVFVEMEPTQTDSNCEGKPVYIQAVTQCMRNDGDLIMMVANLKSYTSQSVQ